MTERELDAKALAWQVGVWDRISNVYAREIDRRFEPVVEAVLERAALRSGESVLDLGCGTGAVAERAASIVGRAGRVVGIDISPEMLAAARARTASRGLDSVDFLAARGESLPVEKGSFDAVLASLSLMYVIDRQSAAREIARVLRPGGRLIAAVWAGAAQCDIVLFQETAGRFAEAPPVPGVGPGALGDPGLFLRQLAEAGLEAREETELLGFDFPDFGSAWDALAGVTTAGLPAARQEEAKAAVMAAMYPEGDRPRRFRNLTRFILGRAV